ncbi:Hypothetical predicted protein [Podarcis lilfordi]|uniref:Uncharacterized protein n=1 Tax=Podarcis lilfordi TaxID=74358 RepID=A0AA35L7U0_9SAUR|nr:Hypothetical predicted protein [Podarcis lilfordi]
MARKRLTSWRLLFIDSPEAYHAKQTNANEVKRGWPVERSPGAGKRRCLEPRNSCKKREGNAEQVIV